MRIDASYPVSFRGRPRKATRDKDVFVSDRKSFDVPEVSLSDMPVVFETREAFIRERDFPRKKKSPERHHVRMMDGAMYRLICDDFDAAAAERLFANAFPHDDHPTSQSSYRGDISIIPDATDEWQLDKSPLSRPLYEQLFWRIQCEQLLERRLEDLWPPNDYTRKLIGHEPTVGAGYRRPRNHMRLNDLRRAFSDVDERQVAYCETAASRHMERFVVADGQLWQMTRGPVFKVKRSSRPEVTIEHAPDWHDRVLPTKYFGLDEREAAFEYAEALAGAMIAAGAMGPDKGIGDYTVPFEVDDAVLGFDSVQDDLFRMGCGVAAENRRFLTRNPKYAGRLAPERLAAVWRGFEEVRRTDYVLGEYGDPIDDLGTNIDIWLFMGRKQSTYSFHESEVSSMMIRRARTLELDSMTISIIPTLDAGHGRNSV
jgi:hypothetical protein